MGRGGRCRGSHEVRLRLLRGLTRHARAAGGQGRQRGRDDPRARRRPRPGRLHHHHRGVRRLHGRRPLRARGARRAGGRGAGRARGAGRQEARRRRGPAAGLGALAARASRCPACSTPSSTSASTTARCEGLAKVTEQRALRLGLLPPLRADVRQRRARHRRRALRGRDQARSSATAGSRRTPSSTSTRCASSSTRSQELLRASRRTRTSSCARPSAPCSTPGWASARSSTGGSTASPTTGAPRSTSSRWCSATRATPRGSGVAFTRDEVTGAPEPSGDFLPNAQGEDVVSGARTPRDIGEMAEWMPEAHASS